MSGGNHPERGQGNSAEGEFDFHRVLWSDGLTGERLRTADALRLFFEMR
jgi:hypothetical protein